MPDDASFVDEVLSRRRAFRVVEPAPAAERIEVTAGLRKVFAVRVDGVIRNEFNVATNALRVASALRVLVEHDALEPGAGA